MAKYFNRGGPICVALRRGASATLVGKSWTYIAPEDDGSEDLVNGVNKGFLVRSDTDDPVIPAPAAPDPPKPVEIIQPEPVLTTQEVENTSTIEISDKAAEKETSGPKTSETRRRRG